jgi:ABC-type multidrug transport system fused ATPase/permease subunit
VDLDLPSGSRTAVVGPSGAGKSTLAALLTRLLDPVAGTVALGGIDLRDLTGDQVRGLVGLVDDRAYLFDSTIAANLRVGAPQATEEQMHAALTAAHLTSWVATLPQGLDTPVGEHGARLSGGQRRRLALARALLAGRPVLVLDEPAEHLDDETGDRLTRELLEAASVRTVVLITHRPAAGLSVDQVVHVADGGVTVMPRRVRPAH